MIPRVFKLTGPSSCAIIRAIFKSLLLMHSGPNHFEYKIRLMDYQDNQRSLLHDEAVLEGLGGDGWELVSAVPIVDGGKTIRIIYYFKKQSRRSMI